MLPVCKIIKIYKLSLLNPFSLSLLSSHRCYVLMYSSWLSRCVYHSTVNIRQPSHTLHRAPRNGLLPRRFASPGKTAIELVGAGAGSATVVADSIVAGATLVTTVGDGEVCSDIGGGGGDRSWSGPGAARRWLWRDTRRWLEGAK